MLLFNRIVLFSFQFFSYVCLSFIILMSTSIPTGAEIKLAQTFLKSSLFCTPIDKKYPPFTLYASGLLVDGVFVKPRLTGDRYKNEAEIKVYPNRKISFKYKFVGGQSEIHQLTTSGKIQPFTKNVKLTGQFKIDGTISENCQIDVTFYDDPFVDPNAEKLANLQRELELLKQQNSTDDSTVAKDKIESAQVPTQEWFANTKNADEQFGSLTRQTDAFLCTTALDITRQKWNDVGSSAAYVVEAQRRALSVNDCRRQLSLKEIDGSEQAKSNQPVASSPLPAQTSLLDICNAALDPDKMLWSQNPDMQTARKQAEGLGLSPPLCRTILGLDKSPELGQKLSEQVQVSSKSTKPNEIKKSSNRVALIIANTRYREQVPLINPENDATLIAQSLKSAGFSQVIVKTDLTFAQSMEAIRDFREISDKADWSVVYYSGHGIGYNGINYLIPIDARLKADRDIDIEAVDVNKINTALSGAKSLRLVILDMCRNNPFLKTMTRTIASRSIGRGLVAPTETEAGEFTVFSAKDGQEALDGEGKNSPFAEAMAKRLTMPNTDIRRIFDYVRDDVMQMTNKQQQPFTYGSLPPVDFFFIEK